MDSDWADKKMFLEELDTLAVQCVQLNRTTTTHLHALNGEAPTSGFNPNPKKKKKNKNKNKKKATAASPIDENNLDRTPSPAIRGGATITFVPTTQQLVVLGGADRIGNEYGFQNISIFHIQENGWSTTTTTGTSPGPRSGHTSTLIDGRWLYVFGGLHMSSESCYNDLYCLDVVTMVWEKKEGAKDAVAALPSPRNGHTACTVVHADTRTTSIYVFGGSSPAEGLMQDMHVLDVTHSSSNETTSETSTATTTTATTTTTTTTTTPTQPTAAWRKEFTVRGTPPTPREQHTCIRSGAASSLYVYGGRSEATVNTDIIAFDTGTQTWGSATDTKMANMSHCAHGFCNQRHMCIYGGCDGKALLNQLYIYNIAQNMWTETKIHNLDSDQPPAGRMAMCMTSALVKDQKEEAETAVVAAASAEVVVVVVEEGEGVEETRQVGLVEAFVEKLYIFGGSTMETDRNDLYAITIPSLPSVEDEQVESAETVVEGSDELPADAKVAKKRTKTVHVKKSQSKRS